MWLGKYVMGAKLFLIISYYVIFLMHFLNDYLKISNFALFTFIYFVSFCSIIVLSQSKSTKPLKVVFAKPNKH